MKKILEEIYRLTVLGFALFPCRKNRKEPADKGWQHEASCDRKRLSSWFVQNNYNIGLPTGRRNNVIVLDFDEIQAGRRFIGKYQNIVKMIVSTPRGGIHIFFRNPDFEVRNASDRKRKIDLRGEGGYVVAPPSVINGVAYRFVEGHELVPANELPVFKREYWPKFQDQQFSPSKIVAGNAHELAALRKRALAYIRKIHAVSGERGHDACFRVCCKLRDFGLLPEEAWLVLNDWNLTNAHPPFSVKDLHHKWEDVFLAKPLDNERKVQC